MRYVFILIMLVSGWGLHAQVMNIDHASQDTAAPKVFNTAISVTIDMDEQKANIFDEDGSLESSWQKQKNTLVFQAISEIVTGGPNNNVLNSRSVQLRDRIFPKHRLHPELFTQYQYDEVKGLQNRMIGGANLRYIIKDKGTFRTFAASGFMYEYEDWNYHGVLYIRDIPANAHDTIRKVIKSTSYIRFSKYLGNKVDFSMVLFYQAQPQFFFKYPRVAGFTQLNFNISELFTLALEYDGWYDTKPVVPIKKYYFSFNEGLVFKI